MEAFARRDIDPNSAVASEMNGIGPERGKEPGRLINLRVERRG